MIITENNKGAGPTASECEILIVDDIPDNIQVAGSILKASGYKISFAQSGPRALELIEKKSYDLILLDIMMPGMSGFEVCEKLYEAEPDFSIPIIFLSARDDEDSIGKGFEMGAVDYITKPFNRSELLARVHTHVNLSMQKKKLSELNATKDKFFSIIAHDLKNFFNAILGFGDVLLEEVGTADADTDATTEYVRIIKRSAESGFSLLENLLQWARSQTGVLTYSPQQVKIKDLIGETVHMLSGIAEKKAISVEASIPDNAVVFVDKNMILTTIRNLLSNALKFTGHNGTVTLIFSREGPYGQVLEIRDTGVGMKEETLNNLFKLDKNVTTLGTDNEMGTGLGLILCKDFMEKNGGTIEVTSTPGKGSSFFLHFKHENSTDE